MSWIHHVEAKRIDPRYEIKQDGDGDMLYLLDIVGGKGLCLCGSNVEIFQLLEDAISHVPMGEQEPTMKPVQALIQKAHDKGLLRYAPPNLVWDDTVSQYQFELARTSMSGVEFGYDFDRDLITWAIQSIDGVELGLDDFVNELLDKTSDFDRSASEIEADPDAGEFDEEFPDEHSHEPEFSMEDGSPRANVYACDNEGRHYYLSAKLTHEGVIFDAWDRYGEEHLATFARTYDELVDFVFENDQDFVFENDQGVTIYHSLEEEQPCQHYAQTRAIVDEEPEMTEHNDVETIVVDDHKLDNLFDQALFWAGEVRQTRMAERIGGNTTWSRSYSRQQFIDAMRAFITEETGS